MIHFVAACSCRFFFFIKAGVPTISRSKWGSVNMLPLISNIGIQLMFANIISLQWNIPIFVSLVTYIVTRFSNIQYFQFYMLLSVSSIEHLELTNPFVEWEIQDPKMEVLYHTRQYFVGIFPYIGLAQALHMVGTSNLGS